MGGRVVRPPAETFWGLVLPSLAFGRKILSSLEANSGVGAFFSSARLFSFLPLWETARHDCNIANRAVKPQFKSKTSHSRCHDWHTMYVIACKPEIRTLFFICKQQTSIPDYVYKYAVPSLSCRSWLSLQKKVWFTVHSCALVLKINFC